MKLSEVLLEKLKKQQEAAAKPITDPEPAWPRGMLPSEESRNKKPRYKSYEYGDGECEPMQVNYNPDLNFNSDGSIYTEKQKVTQPSYAESRYALIQLLWRDFNAVKNHLISVTYGEVNQNLIEHICKEIENEMRYEMGWNTVV